MLPIPFIDYIPQSFTRDGKLTAFADKHDDIMNDLSADTIGLNHLMNPYRISSSLIEYLGYFVNAGILAFDSEATKRNKVATAVQSHKRRGSFNLDAKPKIDNIAGGDSQILTSVGGDDWILPGDGETPSAFYWSALGVDGIDTDLGVALVGVIVASSTRTSIDCSIVLSMRYCCKAVFVAELRLPPPFAIFKTRALKTPNAFSMTLDIAMPLNPSDSASPSGPVTNRSLAFRRIGPSIFASSMGSGSAPPVNVDTFATPSMLESDPP